MKASFLRPAKIRSSGDLSSHFEIKWYLEDTSKRKGRHDQQQTTLTRQTVSLFLDTNRPDFSDTQADPRGFKNFPTAHFKK